jgi:hypothetical protein
MTYHLVSLRGAEIVRLAPLYRRAFGRRFFTSEWMKKKYAYGAQGIEAFACVAFAESGDVAAAFGLLPWPIRYGDRVEVAGQMVDAATADAHRRRGLFTQLGEMVAEECEAAGVSFLFAFPHREGGSYPGFMGQLGYDHIGDLVEYRLPIRELSAERIMRRLGPLGSVYDRYAARVLRRYPSSDPVLENSVIAEGYGGVERDRAFHAYKSAFGGSRVVEVDGGRVWLKVQRGLLLGDVEAASETAFVRTLEALERLAGKLGVHQILFQAASGSRVSSLFERRYPPLPGLAVVYRDLRSQIPSEKLRFTFGDLDNF